MVKMILKNNKEGIEKQAVMYVMILQLSNGKHHVGATDNVKKRIKEHEAGMYNDTAKLLPVKLIFFLIMEGERQARELVVRIRKVGIAFWLNGLQNFELKYVYDEES